jgi:FkbM family methyltransferase
MSLRQQWRRLRRGAAHRLLGDERPRYSHETYSQEGEDILLKRMFTLKRRGFYVDVGAFHPIRISNTYLFYRHGWRGINIDAMPGSMALFCQVRPDDINLEIAVSARRGRAQLHVYAARELNTLSEVMVQGRPGDEPYYQVAETVEVDTAPLAEILDEHLPGGTKIDFMSVDVEGADLDVLMSNDWSKYRVRVVLVEQVSIGTLEALAADPITQFMDGLDYGVIAKTFNTVLYCAREQPFDWFR